MEDNTFYDSYYEENDKGIKCEKYVTCKCGNKLMQRTEEGKVICYECKEIQEQYKY